MAMYDQLRENVATVRRQIEESLRLSGREGTPVTIVAVSKRHPAEAVEAAIEAGMTDVGESRVQETVQKKPAVKGTCRWHLIGHLQSNKINKAIELYDMIQSIDSYELAVAINDRLNRPMDILLQVDSSGEETKFGIDPVEIRNVAAKVSSLGKVRICGLMTIGPLTEDETRIRHSFKLTKSLFESLKCEELPNCDMKYLSMGMSGDYRVAVEEGSNMLRIGTAIFGPRK